MAKSTKSVFDKINETVIAGLKKKGLSWFKCWTNGDSSFAPINNVTGRPYSGFNVVLLNAIQADSGYPYNEWLTFDQAKAKGGTIIKGEKSSQVYFWQISFYDKTATNKVFYRSRRDAEKAGIAPKNIEKSFALRYYNVFNISQCEGIDPRRALPTIEETFNPIERAESVIAGYETCPKIHHKEQRAYYSPVRDYVNMPRKNTFIDSDSYYKVLFHELAHSTGHKSRLDRDIMNSFGSDPYAKEELVAEISAMYLSSYCDLRPQDDQSNSLAYINGWINKIENSKGNEKMFVVSAMTQASKAVGLILSEVEETVEA